MKKYVFLYVLLIANIAMTGYAIWQNNKIYQYISFVSYDNERIERKVDELDQKVQKVWGLTSDVYLKVDR